jgi:hypothetical protein
MPLKLPADVASAAPRIQLTDYNPNWSVKRLFSLPESSTQVTFVTPKSPLGDIVNAQ